MLQDPYSTGPVSTVDLDSFYQPTGLDSTAHRLSHNRTNTTNHWSITLQHPHTTGRPCSADSSNRVFLNKYPDINVALSTSRNTPHQLAQLVHPIDPRRSTVGPFNHPFYHQHFRSQLVDRRVGGAGLDQLHTL